MKRQMNRTYLYLLTAALSCIHGSTAAAQCSRGHFRENRGCFNQRVTTWSYACPTVQTWTRPPLYKRVVVPLCPKLAQASYEDEETGKGKLIGKFLAARAKQLGVTITPLSAFEAELFGPELQVDLLLKQYPTLLCAFNPDLVINDESTFTSCMTHARKWMELTSTGKSEHLMHDEHVYCPNCCK